MPGDSRKPARGMRGPQGGAGVALAAASVRQKAGSGIVSASEFCRSVRPSDSIRGPCPGAGTLTGLHGGPFPPALPVYAGTFSSEAGSSVGGGAESSAPVCKALGRGSFRSVLVIRFAPPESCGSHLHSLRHGSGSSTMWPRDVVPGWPSMRPEATAGSRGGKGASPREPSVLTGTRCCGQGETRVLPDADPASRWGGDRQGQLERKPSRSQGPRR